jgi:hypothetical protein
MAVSARFLADFSSFETAVSKAEAKLADFTSGASKVEKALSRMTDSFSGRRTIQEATLAAKAIESIGGAGKLTEAELQRVGAQAQEAIAKMKALGLDVPAGVQKLADATKGATGAFGGLGSKLSTVNGLLGGLGVGLSVGAIVSFGKALFNDADALQKMSDRTGIGVVGLQRLQIAGDDAGNTIEDMTGAINQMQNRLASGDKSAVGALGKLGITLDQINSLSPDQQFIRISDALRGMKDPSQQVAVAMDLFGKTGAQVLPTLKRGFDDVRDAAVGMSEDTQKAMDYTGDQIQAWWRKTKGVTAEAVVAFGRLATNGFDPLATGIANARREADNFNRSITESIGRISTPGAFQGPKGGGFTISEADQRAFERDMDEQRAAMEKSAAAAKKLSEELAKYGAVVAGVAIDAQGFGRVLDTVDGTVVAAIRYYVDQGVALSELATMYGLTTQQAAAFGKQLSFEQSVIDATTKSFGGYNTHTQIALPTVTSLANVLDDLAATSLPQMNAGLVKAGVSSLTLAQNAQTLGKVVRADLMDVLKNVPQTIASAFTGGGNLLGAVESLGSQAGSALGKGLGKTISSLGSLGGPIGAAIGSLAGPLIGSIAKLFDNPEKQINPIREAYVQAAGGLAALNQKAVEASGNLGLVHQLLDAKNTQQYEAAIAALGTAFDKQAAKTAAATAALGQNSDATKAHLDVLQKGIDDLTSKRNDLWQQIAQEAPEEVMGVIEAAQRGQLAVLDDNIAKQTEDLQRQANEAADALESALGGINPSAVHVPVIFDVPGMPRFESPEVPGAATGGLVTNSGIRYFGTGGYVPRGTDTVPAMLTPGELILNAAQQRSLAGQIQPANDGAQQRVEQLLQRIEARFNYFDGQFPIDLARSMRDQVQLVRAGR